jgi:hypothetical protein
MSERTKEGGDQMSLFQPPPPRRRGRPPKNIGFLTPENLKKPSSFLADISAQVHSGLCQTALPHFRPDDDSAPWERRGRGVTLTIAPGLARKRQGEARQYVGVPYGNHARLIMIYIQTLGMRDRYVPLGNSLSGWMRALGLEPRGGKRGTITNVKEQLLRLANCTMILEMTEEAEDGIVTTEHKTSIASALQLWASAPGEEQWPTVLELDSRFHEHLLENAVTLDREAVASLSHSALALDLYACFAHWLPRLNKAESMTWVELDAALGTNDPVKRYEFARRARHFLPDVLKQYKGARVEANRNGLVMHPSPKPVSDPRIGYTAEMKSLVPSTRKEKTTNVT